MVFYLKLKMMLIRKSVSHMLTVLLLCVDVAEVDVVNGDLAKVVLAEVVLT